MNQFVEVTASSAFGERTAWYEIVEDRLILRDEGNHDNLAGNERATAFEGLSVEQAFQRVKTENEMPVGHAYDGCHACTWRLDICIDDPPEWLVYTEPQEAAIIKAALDVYHKRDGAFKRLKEAIRAV